MKGEQHSKPPPLQHMSRAVSVVSHSSPPPPSHDLEVRENIVFANVQGATEADSQPTHNGDNGAKVAEQHRALLNLPPEILLLIIRQLGLSDVVNLRRVSKRLRMLASPQIVRSLHTSEGTDFDALLESHCSTCMRHLHRGTNRLRTTPSTPGYPLSSLGHTLLRPGLKVQLGDYEEYWVCGWCGWPVLPQQQKVLPHRECFHGKCYRAYDRYVLLFLLLGLVQFTIGVVAAALVWSFFRKDALVFWPTTVNFILQWMMLFMLLFRGIFGAMYGRALFIETTMLCLWIGPLYSISQEDYPGDSGHISRSTVALVCFIGINMMFRFLNVLGNVLLCCDYDITSRYVPGLSSRQRAGNKWASALVLWTYPEVAKQEFPRRNSTQFSLLSCLLFIIAPCLA
ncbi:hypothetical protein NKR23_g6472 [Pleurostoma richardsiae]|uniref:F-box domain-containing protein n=1 Tax=Pleurostoma richardsiae TaxID=41990 RepID=A0AA38RNT2_9PEZI|nr:hypothetical protein NKR23_g6472 [Pleurostoma richardsiae]